MESFQPGLSFSPSDRAKIISRLHSIFTPSKNSSTSQDEISTRAETKSRNGAILLYFIVRFLSLYLTLRDYDYPSL